LKKRKEGCKVDPDKKSKKGETMKILWEKLEVRWKSKEELL